MEELGHQNLISEVAGVLDAAEMPELLDGCEQGVVVVGCGAINEVFKFIFLPSFFVL